MMRIAALRNELGIKQAEIAKKLSVAISAVSMWETGKTMPTADKLPDLAKILGCTIDELFEEE